MLPSARRVPFRIHRCCLVFAAIAVLAGLPEPARAVEEPSISNLSAASPAPGSGGEAAAEELPLADPSETFVRVIHKAYDSLAQYASAGNDGVRFELSDFETLERQHFDEVYYVDVNTPPEGLLLSMKRQTASQGGAGASGGVSLRRTVTYTPSWTEAKGDWKSFPEGQRMAALTLEEVLEEAGTDNPIWTEVTAMTRFRVRVTFAGRSRAYSAAFYFSPGETPGNWQVQALDHVTQGVDVALVERIPPGGQVLTDPGEIEKVVGPGLGAGAVGTPPATTGGGLNQTVGKSENQVCVPYDEPYEKSWRRDSDAGHLFGHHGVVASARSTCRCQENCQLSCDLSFTADCNEGGSTGIACHKMQYAGDSFSAGAGYYPKGVKCTAGFVCAMKICPLCLCSITASVTANAASVTINFNKNDADWSYQDKYEHSCKPCVKCPVGAKVVGGECKCRKGRTPDYDGGVLKACLTKCEVDPALCDKEPFKGGGETQGLLVPRVESPEGDPQGERTCVVWREVSKCRTVSFNTDPPTIGVECKVTRDCLSSHGFGKNNHPYSCPLSPELEHLWPYCEPTVSFVADFPPEFHCTAGERRCAGPGVQVCEDGLWGEIQACASGCDPQAGACIEGCQAGEQRCTPDGANLEFCVNGAWGQSFASCPNGCDAATNACQVPPGGQCSGVSGACSVLGDRSCNGFGDVLECGLDGNGCQVWQVAEACTQGCSGGACIGSSCSGSDLCTLEGAGRCPTAGTVETCQQDGAGCLRWATPTTGGTCGSGEVCQNGSCAQVSCATTTDCSQNGGACIGSQCAPCSTDSQCGAPPWRCNLTTQSCWLAL